MTSAATMAPQPTGEAPLTAAEPAEGTQGLRDTVGLWGNLGISLLLPVAAAFVVLPGRPLGVTVLAIVVGAVIGGLLLGMTAAPAARERVPAMMLLRGLLGRRVSGLPTALNIVQCIGWATFEIVVIAESASRALHTLRWPIVLAAGVLATAMAVRPLGVMRVLARYAVWLALAVTAYLFLRVLSHPSHQVTEGASSFWSAVDVVIALPVSWFPLAGDYTRHARTPRAALVGAATGYGLATIGMFTLGVLALAAYGTTGLDVIGSLLAVPLGVLALLLLVAVELDEVFANIYSTAISAQNFAGRVDRRGLAIIVGVVSTALALVVDVTSYEAFLFLIGAVFVPLAGVLVVAYYLVPRGAWDTSDRATGKPEYLLAWAAGFAAYQLTLPTYFDGTAGAWTHWWAERQADLHISATNGLSASLVSLTVASILAAGLALARRRH